MRARNRNRSADSRAHDALALAVVMVAGLLLGAAASLMLRTAGEWLAPGSAEAQASAAKTAGTVKATPPVKPATASQPTARAAKPAAPASDSTTAPAAARPASTPKASTAPRTGAPSAGSAMVRSSAHLDEQLTYQYNALGRRDPFQSLLSGEYVGSDVGGDAPPDVGGLKVVGIVWGDADQFALVEDARGDSHILRRGDKVMNGFVEALKRDAMVVKLTVDEQSQLVTVPLTRKGEKTNANR
jgi:hypothetical protein